MLRFFRKLRQTRRDILDELGTNRRVLEVILTEIFIMQKAIDKLKETVEQQTTVVDGVTTILQTLVEQVREAKDDPAEIESILAQVEKNTQKLADATVAGTDSPEAE